MPTFDQSTVSAGAPEEVWKLLYDPARFPEWWAGIGSVDTSETASETTAEDTAEDASAAARDYTMFPDGYPDFPMPQTLDSSRENGTVRISCLVSDLCFSWRLRPAGAGTEISVHVEIPDREAARLEAQREIISRSLARLAALAAA